MTLFLSYQGQKMQIVRAARPLPDCVSGCLKCEGNQAAGLLFRHRMDAHFNAVVREIKMDGKGFEPSAPTLRT